MRRLLLALIALLFSVQVFGQNYGNEWIKFNPGQPLSDQQYFKIKTWSNGLYRITYNDLQSVAFPLPFDPALLQMYHQGVEQFIHVEDGGDGSFDTTDYVEFLGKKNDGVFDKQLYRNPDHQPHDRFSLFTDTACYYLTLNADTSVLNRRMVLNNDTIDPSYSPIPWFWAESIFDFRNDYVMRRLAEVKDAEYDEGEGWYSSPIGNALVFYQMYIPNYSADPLAPLGRFSAMTMGGNNTGLQHSITLEVGGTSITKNFTGYETLRFDSTVASNAISTLPTVNLVLTPGTGVVNRTHLSYLRLRYPHRTDYTSEYENYRKLTIPGAFDFNGKSFAQITTTYTNLGNPGFFMLSGDTVTRLSTNLVGYTVKSMIPTYGSDKNCLIIDSTFTTQLGRFQLEPVSNNPQAFARFKNLNDGNGSDYLIVTNDSLIQSTADYAAYRSSTGFTPLVVDVDELYDQFSYGIKQHPLAIKNFAKYANDQFNLKPKYLLLLGKSVSNTRARFTGNNNYSSALSNWNLNYVPTFGSPPADMLFTCFSQDTMPRPVFPVGRISARNNADVYAYLDKITAHESQLQQCPQDWQKRILHFGGGNTGSQQVQITSLLNEFANIAQDTLMGATVKTFLKTSTDPIQIDLSQYLQSLIDSGSALMTFVAHASGTSFDISTDIPQNYNNKDRYPIILANSCFVGDIHDGTRRIAEDFVLLPEKGSIGFIAQPDVGLLDNLQYYSREFYSQMARYNYGNSVGEIMNAVVDSLLNLPIVNANFNGYFIFKSVITGMTLSGDPAMKMSSFDSPDYSVDNSSVFFSPDVITSDLDSFSVKVVLTNLGKATYNPFVLHFVRTYPDGTTTFELDTVIDYVTYKDTITVRFPLDSKFSVGSNYISVYADYLGLVDECNESNNTVLNIPLNIRSSDIAPVYPSEYSIVPNASGFKLKASTVDPFAAPRNYKFQIDTLRSFSSAFLKQGLVYSGGGVVNWQPPFNLQPDLVYYWRVSRDSLPTDTVHPEWKESSFIHKATITGWSQAHYSQFRKDAFTNVIYDESADTTFRFVTTFSSLEVNNYQNISASYNPNFKINNVVMDYGVCTAAPSVHLVVIDSLSLKPWSTRDHTFGEANRFDFATNAPIAPCNGRGRPDLFFIFRMNDPASRDSMFNMLQNGIPTGNYVIAYTSFGGVFSSWSQQMKDLFTTWGSDSINYVNDTQPYIFFTKKGDATYTQEAIGGPSRPAIQILGTLGGNWSKGFVTSVPIGPSLGWSELHWDQQPIESASGMDSTYIDIIGITPGGNEVPLPAFSGISAGNYDVNISSIDANLYPKIKLRAYVQDDSLFTPPQVKRWQVYHQGVPEFALNPSKFFSINRDTLQEGDELIVKMAVENVGDIAADSMLMGAYLFDEARNRHNLPYLRYEPLAVGDTTIITTKVNTLSYAVTSLIQCWMSPLTGHTL